MGTTAMGPGVVNSANTAIGRALRLCLINIGYCKAGAGDPNFIGLPTKFGMCLAENEETSPWPPYHMDRGFKRDDSAVTVVVVTGPTDIIDSGSRTPEDTLNNIASMMFYRNAGAGGWLRGWQSAQVGHTNKRVSYQGPYHPIILSPSRAVILAEAGMSKQDAQAWLHRHCRVSLQAAPGHARHAQRCQRQVADSPGAATSGARSPGDHSGPGKPRAIPPLRLRRVDPLCPLLLWDVRHGNCTGGRRLAVWVCCLDRSRTSPQSADGRKEVCARLTSD